MKSIFKKLMCTAVGAALLTSSMCVFASVETKVKIEDYMYDAKEVYVDDDLEGDSIYPISGRNDGSFQIKDEIDNGNHVKSLASWARLELIPAGTFIDADKVILCYDQKATGLSYDEAVQYGNKFGLYRSFVTYASYSGGSGQTAPMGQCAPSTTDTGFKHNDQDKSLSGWMSLKSSSDPKDSKGKAIFIPQANSDNDDYVKAVCVYERDKEAGPNVIKMRKLYFNGKDVLDDELRGLSIGVGNWWSSASGSTFKVESRSSSGVKDAGGKMLPCPPVYFDNFLIYVPEDFKIKDMEYADDYSNAKLHLTLGANLDDNAECILISEDGEESYTFSEGEDRKELVLDFSEKPLNLEKQSYYISISGIKSLNGEVLDDAKYLISKKSADVTVDEPTMTKDELTGKGTVQGTFKVDAVEDKTVYAVMSVWDGDSCMDFKVQEVQLDSSAGVTTETVSVEVANADKAKNVQMFFVDSIENMKIISNVFAETISK